MLVLQILMIDVIICFIIDISGIIDTFKGWLWKWLFKDKTYREYSLKPFDCSLCSCFWVGLIWLVVQSNFTLFNVMVVCLLSAMSEQITNMIIIIRQSVARLEDWLITKLQ